MHMGNWFMPSETISTNR